MPHPTPGEALKATTSAPSDAFKNILPEEGFTNGLLRPSRSLILKRY